VTPPGNDPDGKLNLASMHRDYDFFKQRGLIDGASTDPENAVDTSFVSDALKTMHDYKR
jgi:hypothetical protein